MSNTVAINHYASNAAKANDIHFEAYMNVCRMKKALDIANKRGSLVLIKAAELNLAWAKKELKEAQKISLASLSDLQAFVNRFQGL